VKAAQFVERALELNMKRSRRTLIGATPADECQREDPERADEQHRAACDHQCFQ